MIARIILLALGAVSLWAVCMCKMSSAANRYMDELKSRKEFKHD